jgi:hypothetical protein
VKNERMMDDEERRISKDERKGYIKFYLTGDRMGSWWRGPISETVAAHFRGS